MKISVLLVVLMLLASASFGQTTGAATIVGTVTDSTGALIPGAKVTVVNTETGVTFDGLTNNEGYYLCPTFGPAFTTSRSKPRASRNTCVRALSSAPTTSP